MDGNYSEKLVGVSFHCQRTEAPDASVFEQHCHTAYELLYLKQGKGKFVVESTEYPLFPGMLLLIRPYEYHYVCPDGAEPYDRIVISFKEDYPCAAVGSLPLLHRQPGEAGLCFAGGKAAQVLEHLLLCGNLSNEQKAVMTRASVEQALLLLSMEEPVAAEANPLMERVMQHLTEHLTEHLSLDALAGEFFLSKGHLCRAFRRHAGVTLLDYITAKRVAYARSLLRQGVAAADCARQAGFGEYSTFYRAYCKHTGHSPVDERKK